MTPAERMLQKVLVQSGINSNEWNSIQAQMRERAFFSSKVESARFLQDVRKTIAEELKAATPEPGKAGVSRRETISKIMERARKEGLSDGSGKLTDLGSVKRAALIADTNASFASGAVRRKADLSIGARAVYPAQELIRVKESKEKRDWKKRWRDAGGKLYSGRMIALVEDEIWKRISRFDLPYPPFDWGSGMGIRGIKRSEAVDLGVIEDDYVPEDVDDSDCDINHNLAVSTENLDDNAIESLKDAFGDQISIHGGKMNWQSGVIRSRLFGENENQNVKVSLGKASETLLAKLPNAVNKANLENHSISINRKWFEEHGSKHFGDNEHDRRNIPLQESDFDLIATLWQNPDSVEIHKNNPKKLQLSLETFDGGLLKLGIDLKHGPLLTTFHKERIKGATDAR